jgi:protoporphyrinogen/coproporphyrinogen III oxidase
VRQGQGSRLGVIENASIMTQIVIVGGGISGLAAAYRLTHRPGPSGERIKVVLLESDARPGGKLFTERVDDFVVEGGADSFLAIKPRGLGLCRELGLEGRLQGTNETIRRTYVMRRGRLYQLPEGLTGLIPTRFGPILKTGLLSPLGKLRMGADFLLPSRPANGDESLAAFVERRLGRELYDRLIEPLMSGIYAGDGEQLSLAATFPQLRQAELEHGGLIKGMLASRKPADGKPGPDAGPGAKKGPAFLTPVAGLSEIVEALLKNLTTVDVRSGVRVVQVEAATPIAEAATPIAGAPPGYTVWLENDARPLPAGAVIFATPAYVTADLIAGLDWEMARALRRIPYVSTATVSVAYRLADIPRPLDGYGYIIPRAEQRPILACTWTSTKFSNRAPEGYGLMRAFVGRAGQEDPLQADDGELLKLVREEFRRTLGVTAPPVLHRIFRWPGAMPQYTLGHLDRLASIEQRLAAHPGLYLAGSAYRGVGIPDCIASGEAAADRALTFLEAASENARPSRLQMKN